MCVDGEGGSYRQLSCLQYRCHSLCRLTLLGGIRKEKEEKNPYPPPSTPPPTPLSSHLTSTPPAHPPMLRNPSGVVIFAHLKKDFWHHVLMALIIRPLVCEEMLCYIYKYILISEKVFPRLQNKVGKSLTFLIGCHFSMFPWLPWLLFQ